MIGTMFIVSAKRDEKGGFRHRIERDVYVELPKSTAHAKAFLDQAGTALVSIEGANYIIGKKAEDFAQLFNTEYKRPLKAGLINPDESDVALKILREMLRGVLGDTAKDEKIIYTVPANPIDSDKDNVYHRENLKWLLETLGYKNVTHLNEGSCAVYGGVTDVEPKTGIGISFGAGMCNVSLVHTGIPIDAMQFSVQRSGDWIDTQVAKATGSEKAEIIDIKENDFDLSVDNSADKLKRNLQIYYEELIKTVVDLIIVKFNSVIEQIPMKLRPTRKNPESIPIFLAGGTASPKGFADLFTKEIEKRLGTKEQLPFSVSFVRLTNNILYTISRGALIYGEIVS